MGDVWVGMDGEREREGETERESDRETETETEYIYIKGLQIAGHLRIRWQVNGLRMAGDTMAELMHLIPDVTPAVQRINTTGVNRLTHLQNSEKELTGW